jgi:hypothetical protein
MDDLKATIAELRRLAAAERTAGPYAADGPYIQTEGESGSWFMKALGLSISSLRDAEFAAAAMNAAMPLADRVEALEAELAAAKRSMDCPLCGRLISAVLYEGTLGVVVFECGGCRMRLTSNCTRETWLSYPLAAARYPDAGGSNG